MDCKTHADSVLAKLMRFRPKPQLPPHARQRVLSETYLQNIDSLRKSVSAGRRENKPFEEDDSNMDVDGEQETKGSFDGLQSVGASNVREKLQNAGRVEDRVSQHFGTSVLGLPLIEDSEVSMQRASFGSDKVKSFRRVEPHSFAHTQLVVCSKSSALKSLNSHFDKKDVPIPRRFHRALDNRDDLPVRKTLSTASSVGANWRRSSCGLRSKRIYTEVGGMKNPKADAKSSGAVAEQVVVEVQHSAWYEYSSKSGSYSKNNQNSATECGKSMHAEDKKKPSRSSFANPFTSSPTGKSRRFTMHRDWDLKLEGSNLQESIVLREDSFFAEWDSERGQSIFMPRVDSECINLGSETSSDIYKLEVQHLLEETSEVQPSGYSSASSGIEILSGNEDWQSSQHEQHRIHGSDFSRKSSALSKQWINSSSALDVEVIDVDDIEEDCLSRQINQQYEFSAPIHDDGDSTSDHFCTPRQKKKSACRAR